MKVIHAMHLARQSQALATPQYRPCQHSRQTWQIADRSKTRC